MSSPPPLLVEDVNQQYPEDLKLKQVQILFRHGERTPVYRRKQDFKKWGFPIFWPLCYSTLSTRAGVLHPPSLQYTLEYEREIETSTHDGIDGQTRLFQFAGSEGICLEGQLTDLGRMSGYNLGEQLRELYVKRLRFLSTSFTNTEDIYMRTTSVVRSRETLHQLFAGLYPPGTVRAIPKIRERLPFEENLYPFSVPCPRLNQLAKQFAKAASLKWDNNMGNVTAALKDILPDGHAAVGVAVDYDKSDNVGAKRSSAWALVDTYVSAVTHGYKTPDGFQVPGVLSTMINASMDEEFYMFSADTEAKRLGMGRFLAEVCENMIGKGGENTGFSTLLSPVKMCLYAAHDSSIGTILSTLGVFDSKWINYTSHIVFELFEKPASKGLIHTNAYELFVRVRYNGKPLELPACSDPKNHRYGDPSMCTLGAFRDYVYSVTPKDWDEECKRV
ncbi:histidine phosphatase superfamily [Dipodascopsis tothii]|uniref:histidine phosphatase superfamily n=1 Tax=Dipodascopsis tothii TaxID=44089 RepID=UPI0034CD73CA